MKIFALIFITEIWIGSAYPAEPGDDPRVDNLELESPFFCNYNMSYCAQRLTKASICGLIFVKAGPLF